ncbi:hypothetical protein N5K37_24400 [Delftia tsuruhatensis]|jgi:hypothetical protein|uniref:hypothetical protein n=1 Tax=Delftia tsuruhatensis TaxID=180282 RepID=UPI0004DAC61A|nr:hypothetical protein [Delftia tsuruhatensis]KEH10327.1 hypothetical protein GY14_06315 [Delftia tsuruhatensis]MDH2233053.1 hypothetical protein [Delftia tsuruhatensis]TDF28450.1 hypothetical protein EZI45_13480 [Delftia tsuruhatensis]
MSNLYLQLKEILAPGRVQIGEVVAYAEGIATVHLPGAGQIRAKGQATVGGKVFVQEGVIQGPAPDLPVYVDVI